MNPKFLTLAFLLSAVLFSAATRGDDGTYLNVSVAVATYEEDPFPDLEPTMLIVRFGKIYSNGLGFEGRLGGSIDSDEIEIDIPFFANSEVELEIDLLYGIYFVAEANLGGSASIYAVAGVSTMEISAELDTGTLIGIAEEDETDASFGAGLSFGPSNNTHLTVEFMSYIDESHVEISTVSIGLLF